MRVYHFLLWLLVPQGGARLFLHPRGMLTPQTHCPVKAVHWAPLISHIQLLQPWAASRLGLGSITDTQKANCGAESSSSLIKCYL